VDQTARIEDGSGHIIVQAVASSVTVGLSPQLRLSPRHRRKHAPKQGVDIDLLNPFTDANPFIGREAELARLYGLLMSSKRISARCLIGRAGTGKTRLALQLCEWAEALTPAWDAGSPSIASWRGSPRCRT
jgi:ATP-dependent Clp protease ATP-binding subunit ClpA